MTCISLRSSFWLSNIIWCKYAFFYTYPKIHISHLVGCASFPISSFDSSEEDPLSADDWLCIITKKLNAVRATDEEKVNLATHQLVGATDEWWENYQDATNEPNAITLQEFVEAFCEYHIPEGIMEIKVEEFRSLRQGPMTVNQYIRKFMKLARWCQHREEEAKMF